MKANRLFWFFLLGQILFPLWIQAQQYSIIGAEYFINSDPGFGNGIPVNLAQGPNPQAELEINVGDLPKGFHRLSVRFRNQDNIWGQNWTRLFFVENEGFTDPALVDYVEYFFDEDDPGLGQAIEIPLEEAASGIDLDALIAVADLEMGDHTISVRIKNNRGLWSIVETREFTVEEPLPSDPPIPDAENLPDLAAECVFNFGSLTAPRATAEDGSPVIGTTDESIFPINQQGTTTIIWTYTDANGLESTQEQDIVIADITPPTIILPAEIIVDTNPGQCFATGVNLGSPVTTDNCGIGSVVNNAPNNFSVGLTEVLWTVTDVGGNTAQFVQVVTVIDNQFPIIPEIADLQVSTDPGTCSALEVNLSTPAATDNCGIASLANDAPEEFPLGTTVVTWTAIDPSGNETTRSFNVVVSDNEAPTITAPADVIVFIGESEDFATNVELGTPEVADNCAVEGFSNDVGDSFPVGTTMVTWTVRDESGNTAIATQTVTVTREILPTITAPPAITVNNEPGTCGASGIELGAATVTGEEIPEDGITNTGLDTYPVGITNVVWTVIDGRGNTATAIQNVTVVDNEAPSIIAPPTVNTLTVANGCESGEIDLGEPEVSDNCEIDGVSNDAPGSFPVGTTTVTWTVRDGSGNEATEEQTVTVTREVLPTITAPPAITVNNDPGTCGASGIVLGTPTVTGDDIPADGIANTGLDTYPVGITNVVWTVINGNGNTATAVQTVTVLDAESPVIGSVETLVVGNDEGTCDAVVSISAPSVSDNCNELNATGTRSDGLALDAPYPVGNTQIIWTATDNSGNDAEEVVHTVTVEDTEAPQITAPANINIQLQAGQESATDVDLGVPITSDNCGVTEVSNNAPVSFPIGTTTVTWTVTDDSGNTETDTQTVTVLPADTETELPTLTAPADILVDTGKGSCEARNVDLGFATITGDIPDGGLGNDAPAYFPLGENIVTWTVTDRNGNSATGVQKVTVRDRELPQIKAPANLVLSSTGAGIPVSEVNLGEPETSDNCSIAELRNNAPKVFPIGTTTVTWTVIDGSGNKCTAKQRVTVNLTEGKCEVTAKAKPVVTLKLNSQGKVRLTTEMADDGSTASCGNLKLDLSKCDFTCEDIGENSVKLIAKDAEGNRDEVEFQVIVVDESKPKIKVEKKAFVWMMRKGDTFTMPDFKDRVEASDNCGFELHQCPEPGTKFRKPENSFVEFEAKDASGNKAKDKFKFNLLVFRCKVPNKNGRTTGEQELSDMLIVPWNTPFDKAISEGIVFEEGSDPEYISMINWQMNDYDPLRPGLYRITASLENEGFEGWNVSLDIPVIVLDKPLAEDIMISRNKVSTKVRNGEIIGSLNTLDPVDDIHSYSMDEHPDFYIEKNVLVWRGSGTPDAEMTVTVHSTDRSGQTISREITLYRELPPGEILIYPNPGREESNILVQLSGPGKVEIRIFDATGRLVYEEKEQQEGSFVRNLNLRGLSAGMYQVIVNSGNEVMTGRLIKE